MITITVNKTKYEIKTDWEEITWSDACAVLDIEMPKDVRDKMDKGSLEFVDWVTADGIHEYARDVAFALGDLPKKYIEMVTPADMLDIFCRYHLKVISDLIAINPQSYTPKAPEKVVFKGVEYMMPKSLRIDNTVVPLHGETAVTFTEAANVLKSIARLKEKGLKHMNYFTAIYLRPQGEAYDEQRVTDRAKVFEKLTMDVYWEVFFCIHRLSIRHFSDTLASFTQTKTPKSRMLALKDGFTQYAKRVSRKIFGKRGK